MLSFLMTFIRIWCMNLIILWKNHNSKEQNEIFHGRRRCVRNQGVNLNGYDFRGLLNRPELRFHGVAFCVWEITHREIEMDQNKKIQ